ncbi:H/ACA ribonucleoprotein complex non-core subunit NAF1 [Empidonax traillii]|uniref:H/ACA ribonucleoprotein complex non-core subunit NAF1 n=1 Tax=Empidonax traillii TaxID=164674 RepID=UPI000FFDB273|nr:H/ACA ribonucleoprotein complex non-core subunit NAF1 [Empidonax traillii]
MEAQLEVLEKLESLAFEPGTASTAPGEEWPESTEEPPTRPEGGGEAQAPLPPAAGAPCSPPLSAPGGERPESAESTEEPPARLEGGGEAQAPLPPAAGAPCSPPPAQLGTPAAAGPSSDSDPDSDSDSDTDSDSSSATSSSVSSLSSNEDDNLDEKNDRSYCIKTKDELPIEELPPVEDLSIILPDNIELKLFGTVSSIIEQLVIIESLRGLPPVNEESIIFKEDRQPAGKIFEIFGPVLHPFYVLRFNNSEHIKEKGINVQDSMYFAPSVEDFTQYVFTEKLKMEKGSDASWKHDQEPPPEVLDFSDDEKEREAKQKKNKPESEGRKKLRPETIPPSENKGFHHSMQQPASRYSRGYRGRGFPRHSFPPPSGPRGFWRPQRKKLSTSYLYLGCQWLSLCPGMKRHHQPQDPKGWLKE